MRGTPAGGESSSASRASTPLKWTGLVVFGLAHAVRDRIRSQRQPHNRPHRHGRLRRGGRRRDHHACVAGSAVLGPAGPGSRRAGAGHAARKLDPQPLDRRSTVPSGVAQQRELGHVEEEAVLDHARHDRREARRPARRGRRRPGSGAVEDVVALVGHVRRSPSSSRSSRVRQQRGTAGGACPARRTARPRPGAGSARPAARPSSGPRPPPRSAAPPRSRSSRAGARRRRP